MNKPLLILLLCFGTVYFCCFSCDSRLKKYTPAKYLNNTKINSGDYSQDSVLLVKELYVKLFNHEDFFSSTEYFDSTRLIIDSIVYSPDYKKMAVFVIIKNPTTRQLVPDEKHQWYYDATSYLGIRNDDSIKLKWLGPNFTNSTNKEELSELIRDSYFTEFATDDPKYPYNLNDIRFWECPVWKKFEDQ
jgi:hypothetical protein